MGSSCCGYDDVALVLLHGLQQPPARMFYVEDSRARRRLPCGTMLPIWWQRPRADRALAKGDQVLDALFRYGAPVVRASTSTNAGPVGEQVGPARATPGAVAGAGSGPAPARARSRRFDARAEESAAAYRIALFCTAAYLAAVCSSLFT